MRAADRWMPLYIADFVAGVLDLSRAEISSYILLLFHQWQSRRPIPDDEQTLANIARCTLDEWRASAPRLLGKFHRVAEGWVQLRLAAERRRADLNCERHSAAGRAGAAARWQPSPPRQPDLPGFAPVDNSPACSAVEMAASSDDVCKAADELPNEQSKNGNRMATACTCTRTGAPPLSKDSASQTSRAYTRARACESPPRSADERERAQAARDALRKAGVRVSAAHPTLVGLVAAGVEPEEFADVAEEAMAAIDRGRIITSPAGWTLATLVNRRREAVPPPPGAPPLDWHATRSSQDAHARALGCPDWGEYESALMAKGIPPYVGTWLRLVESADALALDREARVDATPPREPEYVS
jgi:uncharacterized protein YdaU (DUF1376 family)